MDIGYGEGFVWFCVEIPSEVVKVITDNGVVVTYVAKAKEYDSLLAFKMNSKLFYSTYLKETSVDCKKCKDKCNKNPSDADVSKKLLNKANSKSGVVVTVGDLWFTKDTEMVCEVVRIYEEDGFVWVESYSEDDETVDADPIDQFVVSYTALDGEWVYEKDDDTIDYEDTELNFSIPQSEAYEEGYSQGFADAKYCEQHKVPVEASTFEEAYKIWSETEYLQRSEVNKYRLSKSVGIELVNHPKHYNLDKSGVECIEVARHRNFNVGSALKYLWRCGLKSGNSDIQDLEKAIWYLNDEIKSLKDKGNEKS